MIVCRPEYARKSPNGHRPASFEGYRLASDSPPYNEDMLLEGIFPAVTTPFYPDGRLYLRKLEHNMDLYSHTPAAGLVVLGSTGEAPMLSDEESREVLHIARAAAHPDKVLVAGVAHESVAETLRLAEFAATEGYDVALVRTPSYYSPQSRSEQMLTYYRTVADRSPLPIVLYNIPKFTHYDLPVEVVAELALHPNIIGLKDSTGSVVRIAAVVAATIAAPKRAVAVTQIFEAVTGRMMADTTPENGASNFVSAGQLGQLSSGANALAVAPPRPALKTRTRQIGFQVLAGSAGHLVKSLEAGATGAVLAMAACAPQACIEAYTAWKEKDEVLAEEKQHRLVAASQRVSGELGIAGLKYACDLNGYYGGKPRLPLLPLTGSEREEVADVMADLRN
jgi:4-hydroxy-2-oxoglutarate aldolase